VKDEDIAREAEILSYDLLGKPPLPALQRIVATAAAMCEVANAEINVITARQQHHLAAVDHTFEVSDTEDSLCGRIIEWPEQHVAVSDAREDERLSASPFVSGALGDIVFYAATKLVAPSGTVLGTLCIFDDEEVHLPPEKLRMLDLLASAVVEVLETHRNQNNLLDLLERTFEGQRELRSSHERLDRFAGQVSHELQGPLASVDLVLDMLGEKEQVRADPELGFLVAAGQRSVSRMGETILDLMDYATLGGQLSPEMVDLTALAREVIEDLGHLLDDAHVDLGELGLAYATPSPVRAVFSNLISNAVKYTAPVAVPHVVVRAEDLGGRVRISVADNGPGVREEERESIFDLLGRGTSEVAGHGIGLATCAAIMTAHGGALGLEPSSGQGACFWFELPTVAREEQDRSVAV
jgi:signal transduction histidine kinase